MIYFSTANNTIPFSARHALMNGLASDGGLFVPDSIPPLPKQLLDVFPSLSLPELALAVLSPFFEADITREELRAIVESTFDFPVPLHRLDEQTAVLELFHGPTCAFKDFGARFLARMLGHWAGSFEQEVTVLVATSGDTGSAVAQGFAGVPGTRVIVLYPSGRVSRVQEQQMTTLGGNVTALEIRGSFDDCQSLVKQAFVDPALTEALRLTSANSINIGRLFPQTVYYFVAHSLFGKTSEPLSMAIPSGNFGNVTAALIAKRMGLPIGQIIAATNRNDTFPDYLRTGTYVAKPSAQTLSNAMDVGNPNNVPRIWSFIGKDIEAIGREIESRSCSDDETLSTMGRVFRESHYLLDPHTAVGLQVLGEVRKERGALPAVVLGTAHPAKFSETVIRATGAVPPLPPQLAECMDKTKRAIPMSNRYRDFSDFLLSLV